MGPLGGHIGPILGPSWPPGGLLGASWGSLWAVLGPSLGHLGAILTTTSCCHISLPPAWPHPGPFGVDFGPPWGRLGTLLEPSGASPGPLRALLGLYWGSSEGQRGCMRGCVHSSPALFLSRWPGTSHSVHMDRSVIDYAAPFSHARCSTACPSSVQPLKQFILAPASPSGPLPTL